MPFEAVLAAIATIALLFRALFSTADAGLTGVSPERAEELLAERADLPRRSLSALKKDLEGTAATVRGGAIGSLAVAAALGGVISLQLLQPHVGDATWLGPGVSSAIAAAIGGLLAAGLSFVELVPRSLAVREPEPWALRAAPLVRLASFFVGPVARLIKRLLDRVVGAHGVITFRHAPPALEDIERILTQQSKRDEDAPPAELIKGLFEFSAKIAREVMIPRTRVVSIAIDAGADEVLRLLAEEGHSRLPVWQGDADNIVGVLHTRDLVPLLAHPELIKIVDAIRPPVFVPWATRIGHLLREMQRRRIHMAIVTDEYGGFVGLVTLEDILEEIVGDIRDEHDEPAPRNLEPQPDGSWLVSGALAVSTFNDAVNGTLPVDEGFETLAGFMNKIAGEIPEAGASLRTHGFVFTIADRSPKRVKRLRVVRATAEEPKGPG